MDRRTFNKIFDILKREYVHDDTNLCFLEFENPFEILIMTVLSAQTTDNNVNKVKPHLFGRYPSPESLSKADAADVEEIIHSCGFYHAKARNIIAASRKLCTDFNGNVPRTIAELTQLPGVGRKTANIVLNHAYGINEGIAVDTHVKRVSYRLGMTNETDPVKIETDLMNLVPREEWKYVNFVIISHGRKVCSAKKPDCAGCIVKNLCKSCGSVKSE